MDLRTRPIRFGDFEVDIVSGQLRKRGLRIRLQEQPFQALVALIERPQEVLTREELQKRLWPGNTVVDFDRGLNKAINRLREALGDDADNPRFIETLPQRGYRFLVSVDHPEVQLQPPPEISQSNPANQAPLDLFRIQRRRLFLVAGGGLICLPLIPVAYRLFHHPSDEIQSIAVLPLVNLSGDPDQEYFSDGMTDELIGGLARISSLRVTSRTSIMQFKGERARSLPSIARELKVDAIVEGTVARSGQRVRITVQLVRARDDRNLLSETYERELSDVLLMRSELANAVASQIQMKLVEQQQIKPVRRQKVDPKAYDAFLKGNFFLQQGIRGISKSIDYFHQALSVDPSMADAHVGLAEALCFAGIFGFRPSAETYLEARTEALRALEIDDTSAGAHNVLADVKKGYDWELTAAETEYKQSLQMNRSHLLTRLWYAECLTRLGLFSRAIEESDQALALDPVSPISHNNRAMLLFRARRFDEAIEAGRLALDLDPTFVNALWWQGLSHAGKRAFPEAIQCLTKALGMHDGPLFRSLLGYVYGCAGDRSRALGMLSDVTIMSRQRFVSPVDFAVIHAGLRDADSVFQWLEVAFRTRATRIHELHAPYFDSFRADPRYANLGRRVGLPQ